jgi:integrase
MKIETIPHPSGDQLPILLDNDGLPIPLATEFILARRSLATNTLVRNLRELTLLFEWQKRRSIDLVARIRNNQKLRESEVVGSLVEALRRERPNDKTVKKIAVLPDTFNHRLATVRLFIRWCFELRLVAVPVEAEEYKGLCEHKNLVEDWLYRCSIKSPPTNTGNRKGINTKETDFLIKHLEPHNTLSNTKGSAVKLRNYLVVTILLYHGLRPGELLCLKVKDIEFGAISGLRVTRRHPDPLDTRRPRPQIKRNGRVFAIENSRFIRLLDDYILNAREFLLDSQRDPEYLILSDEGNPLSQASITTFFSRLRQRFPNDLPAHLTAKSLRHSFSSNMEKKLREIGMDEEKRREALAYLRGDSSLDSQNIYIAQEVKEQSDIALRAYQEQLCKEEPQ